MPRSKTLQLLRFNDPKQHIADMLQKTERCRFVDGMFRYRVPMGARSDSRKVEFEATNLHEAVQVYFKCAPRSVATLTQFEVLFRSWRPVGSVPPIHGGYMITAKEHALMQKRDQRLRLALENDHLIPRDEADKLGIPLDHPNVAPEGSRWHIDGPNRTLKAPDGRTGPSVPVGGRPKAPQTEVLEAAQRFVTPSVPEAYPASEDNMAPDAEDYDASDPRAWPNGQVPTK